MARLMRTRTIALASLLALPALVPRLEAQLPPLGEVFVAVERAAAEADLVRIQPAAYAALGEYFATVRNSGLASVDLSQGCAATEVIRPATFARQRQSLWDFGLDDVSPEERDAVIGIWQVTNAAIIGALGRARAEVLLKPFFDVSRCLRQGAMDQSLERLRRYEVKFGPGSPQLNGLEVATNYVAQRSRWFGPDSDGFPGPLELVSSYAPTYIFYTNKPRAASVAEFGVRAYNFSAAGDSTSWIASLLRPRYWAAGVAVLNEREETLAWPWQGDARTGPFINWGPLRVAYIVEGRDRLLVSRNIQLIPLVF